MYRSKTFSETIRPILLLNILFGTGSFVLSKNQKVRKLVESVYMVSVWICYNLIMIMQFSFRDAFTKPVIKMSFFVTMAWSMISYQLMTVLIFVTKFKMKITRDLMKAIDKIDQNMQTIGLPNQDPLQYKHQMYHQVCGWLAHITVTLVATWYFKTDPTAPIMDRIALTFATNMIHIMLMTVQLSFTLWIGYIRMKFSQLNHLLEEMIGTLDHWVPKRFLEITNSQVQKRGRPNVHAVKENVETITKAKNYHLDLIKIARRINKFYGIQLLLTILVWLFTVIILLYIFNFFIWQPVSTVDIFYEVCPVVILLMVTMSRMIGLHSNCMQISHETGKTGFLLCRLYNSSTSIKFRTVVQHFTHQVLANPLVINVCGLVDIDRTFLSSVVGAVFAYLIVIVQLAWPQVQRRRNIAANATDMNVTAN